MVAKIKNEVGKMKEKIDAMYQNIGIKIKELAKVIFIIEAIASIISGFVCMFADDDLILIGLLTLVVGPCVAFVSSWFLYGYGEIIDKTCEIARNTYTGEEKTIEKKNAVVDERTKRINRLLDKGLITAEEYQQIISKEQ